MKFANILAVSALTLAALPASSEELSFANFTPPFQLEGLDDIGITLQRESAISAFETKHGQARPWLFSEIKV